MRFEFKAFQQKCDFIAENIDNKIDTSLIKQRQEFNQIIKNHIDDYLHNSLKNYQHELEQIQCKLNQENMKLQQHFEVLNAKNYRLAFNSWLATFCSLVLLVMGTIGLGWYYKDIILKNKVQSEKMQIINQSDIYLCDNALCANVSKQKKGKYYVIQKRQAN